MKILRHLAWLLVNFVEKNACCPVDCRRNFKKEIGELICKIIFCFVTCFFFFSLMVLFSGS